MPDPITIDPIPVDPAALGDDLTLSGSSTVPHLAQWFGWWHYEPQRAAALYAALRNTDVAAHVRGWRQDGEAETEAKRGRTDYTQLGGIGILSLSGSLMKHVSSMDDGTSTVQARRMVRAMRVDANVQAAIVNVDSPGGTVSGAYDLADDIKALAATKPTYGFASDMACSAGYLQLAMCRSISANRTALVGCIGTFGVMYDYSEMFRQEGVKPILISSGGFKGAGVPGTVVTPEQVSEWQREIDGLNEAFVRAVMDGRKMDRKQASVLADGRTHVAADAKKLGLIDRVESLDDLIARVRREMTPASRRSTTGDRAAASGGEMKIDSSTNSPAAADAEADRSAAEAHSNAAKADSSETAINPPAQNQEGNMPDPVKEPAADAPKPATVKELKQQFADDPAFALEAAENGWTMLEARAQYGDRLQKQDAERKSAEKARVEKERAETPPAGGRGNKTVASGTRAKSGDDDEGDSGDPVADYNAAVEKQMARPGFSGGRHKAIDAVNKRDPELHQAYLSAVNDDADAQASIDRKFRRRQAKR